MTPAPGSRVILLAEADYCYGVGELRLRVERVDRNHPINENGEAWYPVEGVQLGGDGRELRRRQATVRASRLRPGLV